MDLAAAKEKRDARIQAKKERIKADATTDESLATPTPGAPTDDPVVTDEKAENQKEKEKPEKKVE